MKHSALFLRIGAVTSAAYALLGLVFEVLRARVFAAYRAGAAGPDAQEVHERLQLYATLDWAGHLALGVALAASMGLLAASLGRARASVLAWLAFGLEVLGLAASVTSYLVLRTGALGAAAEPGSLVLVEVLWLGRAALGVAALGLFLAAMCVAVERPATAGWVILGTYLGLAVGGLGLFAYRLFGAASESATLDWAGRIVDYGADGLVVGALFWGGMRLARQPVPGAAAAAPERHAGFVDGAPLRLLASALLARVVVAVVGQGLLVWATASRALGTAQALLVLLAGAHLLFTVLLALALRGYLAMPERARAAGALGLALGALALGVVLDLYAAASAVELFGLVGEAERASSFWGMPSLSRIEQLQGSAAWAGRIALLLGLGAALALLGSLRRTAAWVGAPHERDRANRLLALTLVGVAGAVALGVALQVRMSSDTRLLVLMLLGPILLAVGIGALVAWTRLLRGLAHALEHGPSSEAGEARDDP